MTHAASHEPATADLARPARRLDLSRWRDPRLAIGTILVAVSVAGTTWLVSTAGARDRVYVATRAIAPGQELSAAGLTPAEVNLDGRARHYVDAGEPLAAGVVATQPIGPGELVPRSAVASADQLDVRALPISIAGPAPAGLRVGGLVDLWLVSEASRTQANADSGQPLPSAGGTPTQIASRLSVREIAGAGGGLGVGGDKTTVQVFVPVALVPDVLAATTAEGRVALVPVPSGGAE